MRHMLGLVLLLGLTAAVTTWAPSAEGRAGNVRVDCKTRAVDVYFWPHGHGYVAAYRFPARKGPSVTVYRHAKVATSAFVFFLSPTAFNYTNTCDLATSPLSTTWGGGPKATITATRRVRCVFPARVQLKALPQGGTAGSGFRVLAGASARELVRGHVSTRGSSLTFDTRYCTASRVPGVA